MWISQLRYYYDEKENNDIEFIMKMVNAEMEVGFLFAY
jgi:hypothetical protein